MSSSSGADIATISGSVITTLSGTDITIEAETYTPKYPALWSVSSRNNTSWEEGTVVTVNNQLFTDNLSNFLVTNAGDNIVTTPTYLANKTPSAWTVSGA